MQLPVLITVSLTLYLVIARAAAGQELSLDEFEQLVGEKTTTLEHVGAKMSALLQRVRDAGRGRTIEQMTDEQFNSSIIDHVESKFEDRRLWSHLRGNEDPDLHFYHHLSHVVLENCEDIQSELSDVQEHYEDQFKARRSELSQNTLNWLDYLEICLRIDAKKVYMQFLDPEQKSGVVETVPESVSDLRPSSVQNLPIISYGDQSSTDTEDEGEGEDESRIVSNDGLAASSSARFNLYEFERLVEEIAVTLDHVEAKMSALHEKVRNAGEGRTIEQMTDEQFNSGIIGHLESEFEDRQLWSQLRNQEDSRLRFHQHLTHIVLENCEEIQYELSDIQEHYDDQFKDRRSELSQNTLKWLEYLEICRRINANKMYLQFLNPDGKLGATSAGPPMGGGSQIQTKSQDTTIIELENQMAAMAAEEQPQYLGEIYGLGNLKAQLMSDIVPAMEPQDALGLIEVARSFVSQNSLEPDDWIENLFRLSSEQTFECSVAQLSAANRLIQDHQNYPSILSYLKHFGLARASDCLFHFLMKHWVSPRRSLDDIKPFEPLLGAIKNAAPMAHQNLLLINLIDDRLIVLGLGRHLRSLGHDLGSNRGQIERLVGQVLDPLCKEFPEDSGMLLAELIKMLRLTYKLPLHISNIIIYRNSPNLDWISSWFICARYRSRELDYGLLQARHQRSGRGSGR